MKFKNTHNNPNSEYALISTYPVILTLVFDPIAQHHIMTASLLSRNIYLGMFLAKHFRLTEERAITPILSFIILS